jgi:hypothetical protein
MSKLITVLIIFLAALLVTTPTVWAKVEYDSSQLMMQNSEQVTEHVRKRIQRAGDVQEKQEDNDDAGFQAEPEALEFLKDAMRIALGRPDQDGLRGVLFARIRRELSDLNSVDSVLAELADESIASLKDKKAPVRDHSTYIMVLENLMAEIKPEIKTNTTFREIIEKVRDAKIEVSKDVQQQHKLKLMKSTVSPSKTAETILPRDKKKK